MTIGGIITEIMNIMLHVPTALQRLKLRKWGKMPTNRPPKFKILGKDGENIQSNNGKIKRLLFKSEGLRKIFIEIYKNEPCLISEILENCEMDKQNAYRYIRKLITLGIAQRIRVTTVLKKKSSNWMEKEIKTKFKAWTSNMTPKVREYYTYRTSYQATTDEAENYIEWACKHEGVKIKQSDQRHLGKGWKK